MKRKRSPAKPVALGPHETATIEYKEAADRLPDNIYKTIVAFANTKGGTIVLGIKQHNGSLIRQGVAKPQKLIDDLISTVGKKLNYCPVLRPTIETKRGRHFVRIVVEPASYSEKPIYILDAGPLRGGYHRVGSVNLNLNDRDVHRYFRERIRPADAEVIPGSSVADLDPKAIALFRAIRKSVAPDAAELRLGRNELLASYRLLAADGKRLTAAAILLFGKPGAIRGAFPHLHLDFIRIKGTEWGKDIDPFLSNNLRDNLLRQRIQTLDLIDRLLLTPFRWSATGDRSDENAFRKALREALSNLLMHQSYFHVSPPQVRVYNDRIEFYNAGCSLKEPAKFAVPGSAPRNPLIASVFYDLNWAETKGTGYRTAILPLPKEGYPAAHWENDERNDTFTVVFPFPNDAVLAAVPKVATQVTTQVTTQVIAQVAEFCREPRTSKEIMDKLGLKERRHFQRAYLVVLLKSGVIGLTIPDKPRSRFQRYRTTAVGLGLVGRK